METFLIISMLLAFTSGQPLISCPKDCHGDYVIDNYNVSLLPLAGVWPTVFYHSDDLNNIHNIPTFFNISLCSSSLTSQGCTNGGSTCYTDDFRSFYTLGTTDSCQYQVKNRILTLSYSFSSSAVNEFGSGNVTISLVCGPSLGVPEVIQGDPHGLTVEILWITSAVCKPNTHFALKQETKCYLVNHYISEGLHASFIDLSGLIQSRGYQATSSSRPDVVFNVSICRPMSSNDACNGSMVCLYSRDSLISLPNGGDTHVPIAVLPSNLANGVPYFEGTDIVVTYPITVVNTTICGSQPYTKIRFVCPTTDQDVGLIIEYIDNKLCQINFVWVTMHACDINSVQSSSCSLSTPFGDFDLNDLKPSIVAPPSSKYQYNLMPCSESTDLNSLCGRSGDAMTVHATQTNNLTGTCMVIGKGSDKLRYVDSTLTLIYTMGDTCHSGIARTTIITFVCPDDVVSNCTNDCVSYLTEDNCIYEFQWITKLACPVVSSSKCKFSLNDISYNFGLLTESGISSYAAMSTTDDTACYLLNPCGLVEFTDEDLTPFQHCNQRKAPNTCSQASVCQIMVANDRSKGVPLGVFNLQRAESLSTIDNSVISVSTLPDANGKSAQIQYICQVGTLLTTPVYISHATENVTEFHWYTFAACPQKLQVGSGCTVSEVTTGYKFNLTGLATRTMSFNDTRHNYQYNLRICSSFPSSSECHDGNSAICQRVNSHTYSLGQANSVLMYADGYLKLIYSNGSACHDGTQRKTTITFFCNETPNHVIHNVTEVRHCDYLVDIRTPLACTPLYRSNECVFFAAGGAKYDLFELAKSIGNWQAEAYDGSLYIINVCRPLNLQDIGLCNPLSAICRISGSSGKDLGYSSSSNLHGPPSNYTDIRVDLVLTYSMTASNGETCSKIISDIEFICDRTISVDNGPQYISGGNSANPCHYIFRWASRVACPVTAETTTECKISDPLRNYTFNFESLRAHKKIYNIATDRANYTLAICGELSQNDSTCNDAGISGCQVDSSRHSHSLGTYSSMSLTYEDDSISLVYTEGSNCSTGPRKTEIDFICSRNLTSNYYGYPEFVSEVHHCHYLFVWHTALACLPITLECVANGGAYDLRPLKGREWEVDTPNGQMLLGVCQSISNVRCGGASGVGACLGPFGSEPAHIFGHVTGDLVVVNPELIQLFYHNGEKCSNEGLRKSTVINFRCNRDAGLGKPVLVSPLADCLIQIDWETRYACSVSGKSSNWIINNPMTGQTYHLNNLTQELSVFATDPVTNTAYKYTVALGGHSISCGSISDGVSICQQSLSNNRTFVLGRNLNVSLTILDGKVQISYENGDNCHHLKRPRKATIYFEYDDRPDFLEFLSEEECEYSFVVYTKLVYEESISLGMDCSLPHFPDIPSYFSHSIPPISLSGSAQLFFSVCSSISSSNQLQDGYNLCSNVAGACIVNNNKAINLGRPSSHHRPELDSSNNTVIITYTGGDMCNKTSTYTTKILLVCSNDTGLPSLTYPLCNSDNCWVNSCEYIIVWPTRHACRTSIPSVTVGCSLVDSSDGLHFDLKYLSNNSHLMDSSGRYIMGICSSITGAPSGCQGDVGVCQLSGSQWVPIAQSSHDITMVSHSPHVIDVVYPSGSVCAGTQSWTVTVHVHCSAGNTSSHPILQSITNCEMNFDWPTSSICINELEDCFATIDGSTYDLDPLMSRAWQGDFVSDKTKLGIFNISICRNLNPTSSEGFNCFPGPAGICLQPDLTNHNHFMNLGHMTAKPTTESDKIVLQYAGGEGCTVNGVSSNISTTVNLMCPSKSSDIPEMIRVDNCHFVINWMTSVACAHREAESTSCVIQDQQSRMQYNFNAISRTLTFQQSGVSFSVCICPSSHCSNQSQIINVTSHTNLGIFNRMVVLSFTGPQIIFNGGDICQGTTRYSSTVYMRCDRSASENGRFIFEEGLSTYECQKFFSWWTPLACPTSEVICSALNPTTNTFFDFTSLHATDGYWTLNRGSVSYLINICGPIHASNETSCSGNAAVCLRDGNTYTDLAYINTQSVTFNSNHNPEVHFHGPYQSTGPTIVIFELICGINGLNFRSHTGPVYRFEWMTTLACADTTGFHKQSTCQAYTESTGDFTYNPSNMRLNQDVSDTKGQHTCHINMCGDTTKCSNNHPICCFEGTNQFDLSSKSKQFLMDSYWMQVFTTGSNGNATITVLCVGSNDVHSDTDVLVLENFYHNHDNKVNAFFKMYARSGCTFHVPPSSSPINPSSTPNSNVPSSTSFVQIIIIVAIVILCIVVVVVGFFVLRKRHRREQCMKTINSLFAPKSDEIVRYHKIKSKKNQPLIDNTSSDDDDSDIDREDIQETSLNHRGGTSTSQDDPPLLVHVELEEDQHKQTSDDEELLNI